MIRYAIILTSCPDCRFGNGTEMLRDGDPMNILELMRDGLGYVNLLKSPLHAFIVMFPHFSLTSLFAEMPWISYYVKRIPVAGSKLKSFRELATNRTAERFKNGSMHKDIFYYLVCFCPLAFVLAS